MQIDARGAVHLPNLTLPPSELVSPQLISAYLRHIARMREFPPVPALDAPRARWEEFDAAVDRLLEPRLQSHCARFPVEVRDTRIGSVRVGIITPSEGVAAENAQRVLINLHGGAFITGRGLLKGQLESVALAWLARITVITLDYRQAPQHRYPAASEDVEEVYRELLERYEPSAIGLFGCSSGALLASQLIPWLESKHLPRPGALGLFGGAPGAFAHRGDSTLWGSNGMPDPTGRAALRRFAYLESADPTDPEAYPERCDEVLRRFPPTLLISGTRSEEMSATLVAHARFLQLGVQSQLYVLEGGWHGAFYDAVDTPEGYAANAYSARWFLQHLAGSARKLANTTDERPAPESGDCCQ